jgi:DNA polymerase II small subunit
MIEINELLRKGYLVEQGFAELAESFGNIPLIKVLEELKAPKFLSKTFLIENGDKIAEIMAREGVREYTLPAEAEKTESPLDEEKKDVETKAYTSDAKKISVDDFTRHFRNRFMVLKNFIQEHKLEGLTSISKISNAKTSHPISVIGLVYSKRLTKNKNIIIDLEDATGRIKAVISKDKKELFEKAQSIIPDEVIGVQGFGSREILFTSDILFPDIALIKEKRATEEGYAAFTADIHFGSKKFLESNFLEFISWLNGNRGSAKQQELGKKVKYLFIAGDVVDGVGVYPGQEPELSITDVYKQYSKLAEILKQIRKDVKIIICPGGKHDAVRLIEPQPPIPKEIAPAFYAMENVTMTTNPSVIKIAQTKSFEGFNILMYHGDSYDHYMDAVDILRMQNAKAKPEMIMHFLLKKRHLAPTYGSTTQLPSEQDDLIIKNAPDVFVSAHIHKSGVSEYNGIKTISCSCWQSRTAYQEKFGHEPDPCKVPIMDLKTKKITMIDFS